MNVYVDSSVVLRVVLGEPDRLRIWTKITTPVSSELIRVECLRTIDRARIRLRLDDASVAHYRGELLETIEAFTLISIDRTVLERAAEPFPTMLGSMDAMHLSSALLAREQFDGLLVATHDGKLANAARAMGFGVKGATEHG